MTTFIPRLAAALLLATAAAQAPAASVAATPEATVLEGVVVTPTARYTASEWQQRQAVRSAVVLETVVVTPRATYSLAEWQQRQSGLAYVQQPAAAPGVRGWLQAVWRTVRLVRSPVAV